MLAVEHIPCYTEVVEPQNWLRSTRESISPRSLLLLAQFVPHLVDVKRFPVPDDKVSWAVDFPGYDPPFVDEPYGVLTGKDRDEVHNDPDAVEESWEGPLLCDAWGYPLHPVGRTGLSGRGTMNKPGPTKAADAVVAREGAEEFEVLMIERKDNSLLALPAGKLNRGENSVEAVRRETREETGLDFVFDEAELIFSGAVDDNRATDRSWFETQAFLLRVAGRLARQQPVGADDARVALWLPLQEAIRRPSHASTRLMLQLAFQQLGGA